MTIVSIENYYADRQNVSEGIEVESPTDLSPRGLEDWWEDVVFPHTGDGLGEHQDAVYVATVVSSDVPGLSVGTSYEWGG